MWPEAMVFIFNGIENKSHLWGVSPWYWYFTSAIPKALGPVLTFVPAALSAGLRAREAAVWLIPVVALSFLGHKEVRFVFPSVLAVSAMAAVGAAAWCSRQRRLLRAIFVGGMVSATAALSAARLMASVYNYPGGYAMWALHERLQDRSLPLVVHPVAPLPIVRSVDGVAADSILPVTFSPPLLSARPFRAREPGAKCTVHVGGLAASTGVTRFAHESRLCDVDKTEGAISTTELQRFDFLLSEHETVEGFEALHMIPDFERFELKRLEICPPWLPSLVCEKLRLPVLRLKPALYVLQRASPEKEDTTLT